MVYLFFEALLPPLGLLVAYVKRDLASRSCQVLSISLAGLVATDDKDDTAEAEGSRAGKERRRKTEGGGGRTRGTTSYPPLPRPYRRTGGGIACESIPRRSSISPCSLSLHPSTLAFSHPCPHGSLCLVLYGAENYGAVDSVFPLAVPDRRNFRRRVIRG